MSWAGRRRAIIITTASLVGLGLLLIIGFSVFYKVPTCTDHKKNQDEVGVDCGGSCTTLCSSQVGSEPAVSFVRALAPQPGRTDIVAEIENRNANAETKGAPFLLEVYDADQRLVAKRTINVDLPALSTVPLYLPDVSPGGRAGVQAFLTVQNDAIVWRRASGERVVLPTVENSQIITGDAPRITASLVNPLAQPLYGTTVVAIVRDASTGNVVAASQTLVPTLPSQGSAPVVFTWGVPFPTESPLVEIVPVPTLPASP